MTAQFIHNQVPQTISMRYKLLKCITHIPDERGTLLHSENSLFIQFNESYQINISNKCISEFVLLC